ncbi:hypothetical protein [Nocardia sp. NPDC058705]|uniref:hypothetical protein n=1 Tax=Nocardia sp. NPDC058705 TaxID=3346609 RepID=UPI00368D9A3E
MMAIEGDDALRSIRVRRSVVTADFAARLARFTGAGDSAAERAGIDAAFGEDRLDD